MGKQRARKMQVCHVLGSSYLLGSLFLEDIELGRLAGKMQLGSNREGVKNVPLTASSKAVTIRVHSHIPPSFLI